MSRAHGRHSTTLFGHGDQCVVARDLGASMEGRFLVAVAFTTLKAIHSGIVDSPTCAIAHTRGRCSRSCVGGSRLNLFVWANAKKKLPSQKTKSQTSDKFKIACAPAVLRVERRRQLQEPPNRAFRVATWRLFSGTCSVQFWVAGPGPTRQLIQKAATSAIWCAPL